MHENDMNCHFYNNHHALRPDSRVYKYRVGRPVRELMAARERTDTWRWAVVVET